MVSGAGGCGAVSGTSGGCDANALFAECRAALAAAGIDNAAQEADWLWRSVLHTDRHLLAFGAQVPEAGAAALRALAARRARHEPLQYLLGSWPFLDFELAVGEGVLIPRADTECVALRACALLAAACAGRTAPACALDLCAGSGALALALATRCPAAHITAVELSAEALPWLRANTARVCGQFGVPPVRTVQADVFTYQAALAPASLALIVSNPPYLTAEELRALQPEVAFEPVSALDGGSDGLRFYRHLAAAYQSRLEPGGALVLEIGASQADAVRQLLRENGWRNVELENDGQGRPRCVWAFAPR